MKKNIFRLFFSVCFMFTLLYFNKEIIQAADVYIVYNDPNGFPSQAKYMANKYSDDYTIYYVRSSNDFINAWNSIANQATRTDKLIIMLHGGEGVLYFYQEPGWNSYSSLAYLGTKLNGKIMLLSCHGGTGLNSVAYNLSKRSGRAVIAAKNSSVNYNWLLNKDPDLDDKTNGVWARISAIKGTTYKCTDLGTTWRFSYLD